MRKAYKYRIYPTQAQKSNFENQFSMCRHLYNWSLKERMEIYEREKKSLSYYEQANLLPQLKKEKPWFKGVNAQALQDVLRRLDKAFKAFFRRIKEKEAPGFPKFKKKGQWSPPSGLPVSQLRIIHSMLSLNLCKRQLELILA
jgi:putative transposase